MKSAYRLPDEPLPSGFSKFAVNPYWPLLAMMFAGPWLGLSWFVVNSFALGSPTRAREIALVAGVLIGTVALYSAFYFLGNAGWLDEKKLRYALLSVVAVRLGGAYTLYILQSRVCELFQYYGGVVRNGMAAFALGSFIATPVITEALGKSWLGLLLR